MPYERCAAFINLPRVENDRIRVGQNGPDIHNHLAGIGFQAFLAFAAFLEHPNGFTRREVALGNTEGLEHHVEDNLVEIVTAKLRDSLVGDDIVAPSGHADHGRIEGSAAQIVDHHIALGAFRSQFFMVAVQKLDGGCRRFVHGP